MKKRDPFEPAGQTEQQLHDEELLNSRMYQGMRMGDMEHGSAPEGDIWNPKQGDQLIPDMLKGLETAKNPVQYLNDLLEEGWIERPQYEDLMKKYQAAPTS